MATVLPLDFNSWRGNSVPQARSNPRGTNWGAHLLSPSCYLAKEENLFLLVLERFPGRQGACAEGTGFKGLPKEPEAPFLVLPRRKENSPLVKGRGSLGGLHVLRKPAYEMLFRASEKKKASIKC